MSVNSINQRILTGINSVKTELKPMIVKGFSEVKYTSPQKQPLQKAHVFFRTANEAILETQCTTPIGANFHGFKLEGFAIAPISNFIKDNITTKISKIAISPELKVLRVFRNNPNKKSWSVEHILFEKGNDLPLSVKRLDGSVGRKNKINIEVTSEDFMGKNGFKEVEWKKNRADALRRLTQYLKSVQNGEESVTKEGMQKHADAYAEAFGVQGNDRKEVYNKMIISLNNLKNLNTL